VSVKLVEQTLAKGKKLWFYNTGMDRFSWGFFNWRTGSKGRWEWHFCFPDGANPGDYPGEEWSNPFLPNDGSTSEAPVTPKTPGGFTFGPAYFTVCEGITDWTYLFTLEHKLAKAKDDAKKAETVKKAQEFLAALKQVMPIYPHVKGMESSTGGALVGGGITDEAANHSEEWRTKIIQFLKELQ